MRKIRNNIFFIGSIDWDRRLFDELIPLPDGTSYNSYLIKGSQKTAIIDTVDPEFSEEFLDKLKDLEKLDYIISNHAEQDHSGSIPMLLKRFPDAKLVTNKQCKNMLIDLLDISGNRFVVVEDGQEISLGDKTLKFILTPWVHWPETMVAYLKEDSILFSCDFFGSHLAASDLFVKNKCEVYEAAKRYYAEIMMPFRKMIKKNMEKLKGLDIEIIAPSHGPLYDEPEFIMDAYKDWISDNVKNEVVIAYVSMHGSTKLMTDRLVDFLIEKDITVRKINIAHTDIGKLAINLVDAATIIIATPTVLVEPHPHAAYAAIIANILKPKAKFFTVIGSYGWAGTMVERIKKYVPNIKAEFLEPVLSRGKPGKKEYEMLENLAEKIKNRHEKVIKK
ncbi:MBL fold metallo-hydrolase [Candidatus Woesearchaeota archaeon]|nr:MBL fold metallo-hydrolase [Candidatus Woesearchaeota archaeon]